MKKYEAHPELREAREHALMTLEQVGATLDVTATYVADVEVGRRRLRPEFERKLRELFALVLRHRIERGTQIYKLIAAEIPGAE